MISTTSMEGDTVDFSHIVTSVEKSDGLNIDFFLDSAIGVRVYSQFLEIKGWAFNPASDIHYVVAYCPLIYRSPLCGMPPFPRLDVSQHLFVAMNVRTGFDLCVNLLGLQEETTICVAIVTAGQAISFTQNPTYIARNFTEILKITVNLESSPISTARPIPIFVSGMGRSGTTALMAFLNASDDVFSHPAYPREMMLFSYALHHLRVFCSPRNELFLASDKYLNLNMVACTNPFIYESYWPDVTATFTRTKIAMLAKAMLAFVSDSYKAIEPHKPDVKYISEKIAPNTPLPVMAEQLLGDCKEFIMLRSPIDWFQSAISFSHNSGHFFGASFDLDETLNRSMEEFHVFFDYCEARKNKSCFVLFEDLAAAKTTCLASISAYLDVKITDRMIKTLADVPPAHRTTKHGMPRRVRRFLDRAARMPEFIELCARFDALATQVRRPAVRRRSVSPQSGEPDLAHCNGQPQDTPQRRGALKDSSAQALD